MNSYSYPPSTLIVQATLPRMPLARCYVVGIEKVRKARMKSTISGQKRAKQERLEEPARVCQMPLRRAYVVHGLDDVVLGFERCANIPRIAANLAVQVSGGSLRGDLTGCGRSAHGRESLNGRLDDFAN